jgi:hypothetical protein
METTEPKRTKHIKINMHISSIQESQTPRADIQGYVSRPPYTHGKIYHKLKKMYGTIKNPKYIQSPVITYSLEIISILIYQNFTRNV